MIENQPKVLIVDDERRIADTLAMIFSTNGYESRIAYTAEQALEIIPHWLPDLAIIDVVLPGMHGIDLAILFKAECPGCRILLFSGQSLTVDLLAAAAARGDRFDILAKPVHPSTLLETAVSLLAANQANHTEEDGIAEELPRAETDPPAET